VEKFETAQRILFFAWGFGLAGLGTSIAGVTFNLPIDGIVGKMLKAWLLVCAVGCLGSCVGAIIATH
jgi:hypothetical protein